MLAFDQRKSLLISTWHANTWFTSKLQKTQFLLATKKTLNPRIKHSYCRTGTTTNQTRPKTTQPQPITVWNSAPTHSTCSVIRCGLLAAWVRPLASRATPVIMRPVVMRASGSAVWKWTPARRWRRISRAPKGNLDRAPRNLSLPPFCWFGMTHSTLNVYLGNWDG